MKSLTLLESRKLKSVLKLVDSIQSHLQTIGFNQSLIKSHIFQLVLEALQCDHTSIEGSQTAFTLESLTQLLFKFSPSILKTLGKIELALYHQKISFTNGSQPKNILLKSNENPQDKRQKQKKDKKDKKDKKNIKTKPIQNPLKLFVSQNPDSENIFIRIQKSSEKSQPQNTQNIFRPSQPLQQSTLMNYNIFGGMSGMPLIGMSGVPTVNIFKRRPENEQSEVNQMTQNGQPASQMDQSDELRRNLRQIQMFKQFVESQMIMEMLGGDNQGNENSDTGFNMRSLLLGRSLNLGE